METKEFPVPRGREVLQLARPLAGMKRLLNHDPFISDLAALLTDVKPVIYIDFEDSHWPYLSGLCEKLRLRYLFPEELYPEIRNPHNLFHLRRGKKHIIIGKDMGKVETAARHWKRLGGVPWGLALGYPECCVKHYTGWKKNTADPDIMRHIYLNTRHKEKLSFMLNNTWNLYSQSRNSPKETRDFRKMDSLNTSGLQFVQVISWHPCAYDCHKSLAAADKIYAFMSHYVPEHAFLLKKRLSKPVVMLDKYKFIAFNGFIDGRTLYHAGIAEPRSLIPESAAAAVTRLSKPYSKPGISQIDIPKLLSALGKPRPFVLNFTAEKMIR
jgi:hypothetical protein